MKLNQLIAIETGVKSQVNADKSTLYHKAQKEALFNGLLKRYTPTSDDGEKFPDEKQRVQLTAQQVLEEESALMTQLFDVESAKDYSNCNARADVIVDGKVLLENVPVPFLLLLSKELENMKSLVEAIPVLSEDEDWSFDESSGLNKTGETKSLKSKKVQKPLVLYPATDKHPAQTQLITEDVTIGTWSTVKMSGAIKREDQKNLVARITKLQDSVKSAREQANMIDVVEPKVGRTITDWLFGK